MKGQSLHQEQSSSHPLRSFHPALCLGKLHSLTGLVPAGVFTMLHLRTNAEALSGPLAFEAAVTRLSGIPCFAVFEAVGLWFPLGFHAFYGLYRLQQARPCLRAYPSARHWAYVAQRLSGLLLLIFVLLHLYQFRLKVLLGTMSRTDYFQELSCQLSSTDGLGIPRLAIGFLLANASVSFHCPNGCHTFFAAWGITTSRRASRRMALVCGALGLAWLGLGSSVILHFATGWRLGGYGAADSDILAQLCSYSADGAEDSSAKQLPEASPRTGAHPAIPTRRVKDER